MKTPIPVLFALMVGCSSPVAPSPADAGGDAGADIPDSTMRDAAPDLPPVTYMDFGRDAARDAGADTGARDVDVPDARVADMASDAGADAEPDAAPCVPPADTPLPLTQRPLLLSETGLYTDIPNGVLAPGVERFAPRYTLWSDGAVKDRFVWLPPCEKIDNTDQDFWSFPIGTRLWKTFTRDGVRIETRLITRWGPGREDYHFAAYVWRDDGTDADFVEFGVVDAKGTPHDVPAVDQCEACHGRLPEPYLGFGAIMLTSQNAGVTMASLSADGRLAVPSPQGFEVPGTQTERDALGYLHANCSNCHNETAFTTPFATPFSLRVSVADVVPADTGTYRTAVGQFVTKFIHPACVTRVLPGEPDASCVHVRMAIRGSSNQMPVIGTEIIDPVGLATIRTWIESL